MKVVRSCKGEEEELEDDEVRSWEGRVEVEYVPGRRRRWDEGVEAPKVR